MSLTRTLHRSIDISASPERVYDHWRRLTEFPEFMDGVEAVQATADEAQATTWIATIGGRRISFHARIVEDVPGQRIAWKSTRGPAHAGVATFHRISDDASRLIVEMDYEPDGWVEVLGDTLGIPGRFVEQNLERFKAWVEAGGPAQLAAHRSREAFAMDPVPGARA